MGCESLGVLLLTGLLGPPLTCPHRVPQIPDVLHALQGPCLLPCWASPDHRLSYSLQSPAPKPLGWDFQEQRHPPQLKLSLRSDLRLGGERAWTLQAQPYCGTHNSVNISASYISPTNTIWSVDHCPYLNFPSPNKNICFADFKEMQRHS